MILSLWNKNKENGDSDKTTGIYMLDYMTEQESYTFYDVKSETVIYSALPYNEGILYTDYSFADTDSSRPIKSCSILSGRRKRVHCRHQVRKVFPHVVKHNQRHKLTAYIKSTEP